MAGIWRILTMNIYKCLTPCCDMEIMLGATAMLTGIQVSWGVLDNWSIASFKVSMPVALLTWQLPRYWARRTFFGSSIGVGNDWSERKIKNVNKDVTLTSAIQIGAREWSKNESHSQNQWNLSCNQLRRLITWSNALLARFSRFLTVLTPLKKKILTD